MSEREAETERQKSYGEHTRGKMMRNKVDDARMQLEMLGNVRIHTIGFTCCTPFQSLPSRIISARRWWEYPTLWS